MNPVGPQPKEAPKVAPESERKAEAPQEAAPASAAAVASSVADCKKALKDGDPVKVENAQQTDHVKPVLKLTDKDQVIFMLTKILTGDDLAGDGSGDPIVMVGKKMRKTSPKRTIIGMKKNNSEKNTKKSKDLAKMLQAAVKPAMKRSDPYEGETDAENLPPEESENVEPVTTGKMKRRGDLKTLQDSTTTDSSESVSSASRVTSKKQFPAPAAAKRQRMSRQDKQELKAASKKDVEKMFSRVNWWKSEGAKSGE